MTDFKSWLEGFLEGKESLDAAQIEAIKEKMKEPEQLAPTYPIWIHPNCNPLPPYTPFTPGLVISSTYSNSDSSYSAAEGNMQ